MKLLDDWQVKVLNTKGHLLVCSGRQTGKSYIISNKAGNAALGTPNFTVLIVANTERQSEALLQKCLDYVSEVDYKAILQGVNRPTKKVIKLTNGSLILCLPTGASADGIRCYTVNLLIIDEAAYVSDNIFSAITPMLLTTGGEIWLVSTPRGRTGYFWDRYSDPTFTKIHVNSEEVMYDRPICDSWTLAQREGAKAHLERERKTMTKKVYSQEYLGMFIEELSRYFPDDLIEKVCTRQRERTIHGRFYLGVDVARLGSDDSTFEIVNRINRDCFEHVDSIITSKTRITKTIEKIIELNKFYKFCKIYIDDAGVGSGVYDCLLLNDQVKRKIVSINNASRSLDRQDKQRHKLLKEDLYNNMLVMMEQGKVSLLKDDEVIHSLKSVQYEYLQKEGSPTKMRIYGRDTHITEGLIRSLWANKDKHLNIWVNGDMIT